MIDSHCHLDLAVFDNDIASVIDRAQQAGVTRFHIPGTTRNGWQKQQKLATEFAQIDFSCGLHPYFLTSEWLTEARELSNVFSQNSGAIAIGEIGLDGVIDIPHDVQLKAFEYQLNLANELGLPVVMHHRKTHHELLASLKKTKFAHGGVIHAFSGSADVAKRYIERGFYLGIGGTITYERSNKTRHAIKAVSLSNLVLETDSPDMPVCGFQGQRNEPARLIHVANALAEICDVPAQSVVEQTSAAYLNAFAIS